jgi:hypothetical protein
MIFSIKFLQILINRKEPKPQFVISAPEGTLISTLGSRLRLRNTDLNIGKWLIVFEFNSIVHQMSYCNQFSPDLRS